MERTPLLNLDENKKLIVYVSYINYNVVSQKTKYHSLSVIVLLMVTCCDMLMSWLMCTVWSYSSSHLSDWLLLWHDVMWFDMICCTHTRMCCAYVAPSCAVPCSCYDWFELCNCIMNIICLIVLFNYFLIISINTCCDV